VLHEDDDVLVVEKPAGLVTADPARAAGANPRMMPSAREGQTLFDVVKRHVKKHAGRRMPRRRAGDMGVEDRPGRVWVIHRLDKEASGVLVFAKSERSFESLKAQFGSKAAHRVYTALAEGVVGEPGSEHTRESMIQEDREPAPAKKLARRGDAAGPRPREPKLAVTHYRVVGVGNDRSLLRVRLETGRKNQIRVHMQEIGHPLVGDLRFGAVSDPIGRVGLHAAELGFTHPGTGREVRFSSPAPAAFYRAVGMEPGADVLAEGEGAAPAPRVPAVASRHQERPDRADGAEPAADTSWDEVAGWYDAMLEDKGNDHYERVILPGTLALLGDVRGKRVLDVACGQGLLCRRLAGMGAQAVGVDASPRLIAAAKERSPEIEYHVGDARELGPLGLSGFDLATCVMALSNIDPLGPALSGIAAAVRPGGVLVCVITHPAFRAPGQTSWGWDDAAKRQFRRIDAYLTPFRKDIQMHPGKRAHGRREGAAETPTFHRPVGAYVSALGAAGLLVTDLAEWVSQRAATSGPRAPEENRARLEIPLFMGIRAVKTG
jgi:23S rRNA-/tRNA-specific pseudouridylate synthase/ubiquinone/menaquinone biosynthesis C-methylase UbiE